MRYRLSLVVGHTADSQGAFAVQPIGMYEYSFNTGVAQDFQAKYQSKYDIKIFFRDKRTIVQTYLDVESWAPHANIELHFNSSTNKQAFGTETLCTTHSRVFAKMVQDEICKALSRDVRGGDRGVKILSSPLERGYISVSRLRCPNILIEPFFGHSPVECALMLNNLDAVYEGISRAFDVYMTLN